jgi:hypothetical protein
MELLPYSVKCIRYGGRFQTRGYNFFQNLVVSRDMNIHDAALGPGG